MEILIIGGSDSSGGAGIQRDQRVLEDHGCRGNYVISAITTQNSDLGVTGVYPTSARVFQNQLLEATRGSYGAIKIGALFTSRQIALCGSFLKSCQSVPVVLDPVLAPSLGKPFLRSGLLSFYKKKLFPHISLLCPNHLEALRLEPRETDSTVAAQKLVQRWKLHLYLKGGHGNPVGHMVKEVLFGPKMNPWTLYKQRMEFMDSHGTGCSFAVAAAAGLAKGVELTKALQGATEYVSCSYGRLRSNDKGSALESFL